MKIKISSMLEHSRFVGAAIKLQRFWRKKLGFKLGLRLLRRKENTTKAVKRNKSLKKEIQKKI